MLYQRRGSGSPEACAGHLCAVYGKLKLKPEDCLIVEDSTNGGKAAAAAGTKCVWFHNPDSGDQQIPHAVLEIASWSQENVEKS